MADQIAESDTDKFYRQLKYTKVIDIYNNLTDSQKLELELYLGSGNTIGPNGGIIDIEP